MLGGATICQGDRKFDTTATLFAEGDQPALSFFGHYDGAIPRGLESGRAVIVSRTAQKPMQCSRLWSQIGAAFG